MLVFDENLENGIQGLIKVVCPSENGRQKEKQRKKTKQSSAKKVVTVEIVTNIMKKLDITIKSFNTNNIPTELGCDDKKVRLSYSSCIMDWLLK